MALHDHHNNRENIDYDTNANAHHNVVKNQPSHHEDVSKCADTASRTLERHVSDAEYVQDTDKDEEDDDSGKRITRSIPIIYLDSVSS